MEGRIAKIRFVIGAYTLPSSALSLMPTKLMRRKEKENVKLNHEIENANEEMYIYSYEYCHIESYYVCTMAFEVINFFFFLITISGEIE